jgi:hypothetical protein
MTYVPDLETTPVPSQHGFVYSTKVRTNLSLLEDVSRHDTHLASIPDNTRTVTTDHPTSALALQRVHDPDLIALRDTLGDGHDELDLILNGLDNGVGSEGRGNVDDRCVGLGLLDRVFDGAEDGESEVSLAGFLL